MSTLQSDITINYANQIINLVQQIANVRAAAANIISINSVDPIGNLINNLNTTKLNSDGSLGTADDTPTSGDYIDSRVYPAITRVVKNTDIINALQVLSEFSTFCSGTTTASDGARPAFINAVAM